MSAYDLHRHLHQAFYVLGALAAVALVFSVRPRTIGHLRFAGFLLATLACAAYLGDNFVIDSHSPVVTLTGPIAQMRIAHGRRTYWYEVKLLIEGQSTPWLDWLSDTDRPPVGDTAAIGVHAWKMDDSTDVKVLTGPKAGDTRHTGITPRADLFPLLFPAFFFVFFTGWWIIYAFSSRARAE